jgi:FdhE protein
MTNLQIGPDYDGRIRRALQLTTEHPFAAEILTFYRRLAAFQKEFHAHISKIFRQSVTPDSALQAELAVQALLPHFPGLLATIQQTAPAALASTARELTSQSSDAWATALKDFWMAGRKSKNSVLTSREKLAEPLALLREFVFLVFLQPYSEYLAALLPEPQLETTYYICPRCAALPLLGVLRPEGDGGKRFLLCSFCLQEWSFRRILCPACGEESESKLPVYVAEQFPHVRVEACDTCKYYLRTVDLTKNGNAVPIVDDLAALPLSLWADEQGFSRIQPNLLGT